MLDGQVQEPTGDNAAKLCRFFNVTRDQLLGNQPIGRVDGNSVKEAPATYQVEEFIEIPMKEIQLRAASDPADGFIVDYVTDDSVKPLYYRRDWIEELKLNPSRLIVRQISGSSMESALFDGDFVLINLAQTTPRNGIVYQLAVDGQLLIKRLRKRDGAWWVTSDNPAYSKYDQPLENENQVLGQVVHKSSNNI
jgi:phage repressor protein C with HTH and peptisase S24 domain